MVPPLLDNLARFALSISAQVVVLAVLSVGVAVVAAQSEPILVLAILASYFATAVLVASLAAPEMAFAVVLIGIFVALMMQFTAVERRQLRRGWAHLAMPRPFRVLIVLVVLWLAQPVRAAPGRLARGLGLASSQRGCRPDYLNRSLQGRNGAPHGPRCQPALLRYEHQRSQPFRARRHRHRLLRGLAGGVALGPAPAAEPPR